MTEIPGMVERVARALFDEFYKGYLRPQMSWEERPAVVREYWIRKTAIAIAAHVAALSDAGMVIVPREPTFEMGLAGGDVVVDFDSDFRMPDSHARAMWRAMVAAAHTHDVFK